MATFNTSILQQYYDTRNYLGAAKYLESIPAKDPASQAKVNSEIAKLKRDAAIQENIIKTVSPDEFEAYSFIQGINGNGTIPRDKDVTYNANTPEQYTERVRNSYGTQYFDYINSLKAYDGNPINKIAVDLDNDDVLKSLTTELGFQNISENDLGITHYSLSDGRHRLCISTDNKNLYKLLNAANKISSRSVMDILGNISMKTATGGFTGAGIGSFVPAVGTAAGTIVGGGVGLVGGIAEEVYNAVVNNINVKIRGVGTDNRVYDDDSFNSDNLNDAVDVVNDANEIYNKINENSEQKQTFTSETQVTQFLGMGHAEAYKAMQQGKLDPTTFDRIQNNWKEYYDRLITNSDFAQKKVYAWSADSEEGKVLKEVGNVDIPDLQGEVLLAMSENRVDYSLATVDGEIGTMITIKPKNSGDKAGRDGWSKAKGEVYKQIFVENLFEESANEVFERDTKTVAARRNADMKKYNYEQELSNGATVGWDKEVGSYAKVIDEQGKAVKVPITEDDMLRSLNESAIIDNTVNSVLSNMDNNGKIYPQKVNNQWVQPTVEGLLQSAATEATEEIYPKGSTTDVSRYAYQHQLYLRMMQVLNMYLNQYKNN